MIEQGGSPYLGIDIVLKNVDAVVKQLKEIRSIIETLSRDAAAGVEALDKVSKTTSVLNEMFTKLSKTVATTFRWVMSYQFIKGMETFLLNSILLVERYNKGLTTISAQALLTTYEVEKLGEKILQIAKESLFAPTQLIEIAGLMARAGLKTQDIEELLPIVNKLAILTSESIDKVGELMISIKLLYGFSGQEILKVANVLFYALNQSKLALKDIADAWKYIAPAVATTKDSFSDVMAVLMVFKDVAQMSASTLGTSYRQVTQELLALTPRMKRLLELKGVDLRVLDIHKKGIIDLIETLRDAGITTDMILQTLGRRGGASTALFLAYIDLIIARRKELQLVWKYDLNLIDISFEKYRNSLFAFNFLANRIRVEFLGITKELVPAFVELAKVLETLLNISKGFATAPFLVSFLLQLGSSIFVLRALSIVVNNLGNAFKTLSISSLNLGNILSFFTANISRAFFGVSAIFTGIISLLEVFGIKLLSAADKFILFVNIITSAIAFRIHPYVGLAVTAINMLTFAFEKLTTTGKRATYELEVSLYDLGRGVDNLAKSTKNYADTLQEVQRLQSLSKQLSDEDKRRLEELQASLPMFSRALEKERREILDKVDRIGAQIANLVPESSKKEVIKKFNDIRLAFEDLYATIDAKIKQGLKLENLFSDKEIIQKIANIEIQITNLATTIDRINQVSKKRVDENRSKFKEALTDTSRFLTEFWSSQMGAQADNATQQLEKLSSSVEGLPGNVLALRDAVKHLTGIPQTPLMKDMSKDFERINFQAERGKTVIENLTERIKDLREQLSQMREYEISERGIQDLLQYIRTLNELIEVQERLFRRTKSADILRQITEDISLALIHLKEVFTTKIITPVELSSFLRNLFKLSSTQVRTSLIEFVQTNRDIIIESLKRSFAETQNITELSRLVDQLISKLIPSERVKALLPIQNMLESIFEVVKKKVVEFSVIGDINRSNLQKLINSFKLLLDNIVSLSTDERLNQVKDLVKNIIQNWIESLETGKISEVEFRKRISLLIDEIKKFGISVEEISDVVLNSFENFEKLPVESIVKLINNLRLFYDIFPALQLLNFELQLFRKLLEDIEKVTPEQLTQVLSILANQYETLSRLRRENIDVSLQESQYLENLSKILQRLVKDFELGIITEDVLFSKLRQYLKDVGIDLERVQVLAERSLLNVSLMFLKFYQNLEDYKNRIRELEPELPETEILRRIEVINRVLTQMLGVNIKNFEELKKRIEMGTISMRELSEVSQRFGLDFNTVWTMLYGNLSKADQTFIILKNAFKNATIEMQSDVILLSNTFSTMFKTMADAFSDMFVNAIKGDFEEVKNAFFKLIQSLVNEWLRFLALWSMKQLLGMVGVNLTFPFGMLFGKKGLILPGTFIPVKEFAYGGIVNRPTLGLIGEGGRKEAVVPLPDNRHIPVKFIGEDKPKIEAQIVNIIDPNLLGQYLSSSSGRQAILNVIGLYKDTIRKIILS